MNHKILNKLMNKILLTLNNVETVKQTLFNISYLIWLLKLDVKTPRMKTHKIIKIIRINRMLFIYIQRINLNLNCLF